MSFDINALGAHKVISVSNGETRDLKNFWEDQDVVIIFFRRWGCCLGRLWAKELGEIAPILQQHNVKLIGVGVEEVGCHVFIERKLFDGDLYYVEDISTYNLLRFKRFNTATILTSLLWKQNREALLKAQSWGMGFDLKGDWVQTGGALLVEKGGKVLQHFVQTGPGDHLSNLDILKNFGLENEYETQTTGSMTSDKKKTDFGAPPPILQPFRQKRSPRQWLKNLKLHFITHIHTRTEATPAVNDSVASLLYIAPLLTLLCNF